MTAALSLVKDILIVVIAVASVIAVGLADTERGRFWLERVRLAWFVFRKGLPVSLEYSDGKTLEWKES